MQRYILTEYADACSQTQEVYDEYLLTTGSTSVPVWLKSMGHNPHLARAYWERAKGSLFGGALPLALKEMIVFVVSAKNGTRYCSACHAHSVLNLDKTLCFEDLLNFLSSESHNFPPYYRPIVDFALKVQKNPNALEDVDFMLLMEEGFSKEEIGEVISVIDMAMMFNVYTSALQLDLDPEYRAIL